LMDSAIFFLISPTGLDKFLALTSAEC